MITRKVLRSSTARSVRACTRSKCTPSKARKFSTSTSSTTTPSPSSNATSVSSFGAFTNELDRIAPRFEIHGSQIKVLRTPAEFYETLKVGICMDSGKEYYTDGMCTGKDTSCGGEDLSLYFVYRKNWRWTCKSYPFLRRNTCWC